MKFPKLNNPMHLLATCFGIGIVPFAPGTFGTLFGVFLIYLISLTDLSITYFVISLIFFSWTICILVSKELDEHDHSAIVIDELAGYAIIYLFIPTTFFNLIFGFILFRVFDIFKPFPISWLDENIKNGSGIIIDDLVAGILSGVIILLFQTLIS